jgi:hypothetical protein
MTARDDNQPTTCIAREFIGAKLGDRRRQSRLVRLGEQCRAAPEKSFPDIAGDSRELTACYRLLRSDEVTLGAVLEPHIRQTAIRCAEARSVIVIHDTTECEFSGEKRRGLGKLRGNDQGFLLHPSLAIAGDGSRRPLGVLAAQTWKRDTLGRARHADGSRKSGGAYHSVTDKESARWWRGVDAAEQSLGGVQAIHVMDREGDAYHLVRDCLDNDARFVIRMARDRVLLDEDDERLGKASEVLACCEDVFTLEAALSRRPANPCPRSEPAREARQATLAVTGIKARLARPNYDRQSPESLEVNLVCVRELNAPEGVEPVAWVLITTDPIDTPAALRAVVETYRTRWLIEEFFKALKTGCAFEKRQLESYDTLTAALGIFLPIAWHLLLLRHQARTAPDEPAQRVLSPVQMDVLRARLPKLVPAAPTVADALRAIAYLGGHFIKRPPGWLVLGRGLQELLGLETGWRLARGMELEL